MEPLWLATFSATRSAMYARQTAGCGRTAAMASTMGSPPCSVASTGSMKMVVTGVGVVTRWWWR